MIISVEQKHITMGDRLLCGSCPIALALRDNGFIYPRVLAECIEANDGLGQKTYYTPRSALRFMKAFDSKKPVKSFRFKLTPVIGEA